MSIFAKQFHEVNCIILQLAEVTKRNWSSLGVRGSWGKRSSSNSMDSSNLLDSPELMDSPDVSELSQGPPSHYLIFTHDDFNSKYWTFFGVGGPSYPPSRASHSSFTMWGTALLDEWLRPGLYCILKDMARIQELYCLYLVWFISFLFIY